MIELAIIITAIGINYLIFAKDYTMLTNMFNVGLSFMIIATKFSNTVMGIGLFLAIMFIVKTIYDVKEGK